MAIHGYGSPVIVSDRPVLAARYGLHWVHARPDGGPCLRDQVSWRTVAGVMVNTPRGAVWLHFRRWRINYGIGFSR